MDREKELGQALNNLITFTEQALDEGWIYSETFRSHLADARKAVTEEQDEQQKDFTYPIGKPNFHIIHH